MANLQKIDAAIAEVARSYQARGYMDAVIRPKMILNDVERLASYDVPVEEGIQYHRALVRCEGVPDRVARDLLKK